MKKLLCTILVLATICINLTSFAAMEESHQFSEIDEYYDLTYVTPYYGTNGGIVYSYGNITPTQLPYGMINLGEIHSICVYGNRIYYLTSTGGSGCNIVGSIYSCNMLGSDNVLIADNAFNFSKCFIVDGTLYYSVYGSELTSSGVCKINLWNYSWSTLVSGKNVEFNYCDGDFVYYQDSNNYFATSVNGATTYNMSGDIDEYENTYMIKGNETFLCYGDQTVKKMVKNDFSPYHKRYMTTLASFRGNIIVANIKNISSTYVYYTLVVPDIPNYTSKAQLYRTNRN